MVELRVFGPLDLRDERRAELRPVLTQPKRVALLAYFALARPRLFARRDKVLALFWPELDAPHARDALNQALRFLRRELGDEVLLSRGAEEIGLSAERLSCDCWAFETRIEADQLDEALTLYRGDLLESFHADTSTEFDSWLEAERARLRALARSAASQLSTVAEAAGELSGAIGWSRRALLIDPLDEQSLRRLVQLLDRSGDRAAAVRAYQEFARI